MRISALSVSVRMFPLIALFSLANSLAQAQITEVKLIDATHITVTEAAAAPAGTISLYSLISPYTCAVGPTATALELVPPPPIALVAGGTVTLTLKSPLASGATICAIDSNTHPSPPYIYIPARQPVFSKPPTDGSAAIAVQATSSDTNTSPAWTTTVKLLQPLDSSSTCDPARDATLSLASGSPVSSQTTDAAGNAAFTLATPLVAGSLVCVYQTVTPNSALKRLPVADPQTPDGSSPPTAVTSATDWGLIRAYFTGGIVIANDNSNFSSAHQFFALNVDKTWIMPRCPACASASPTTPSSGPAALTVAAGTTQLTVGSGSRYEVWGKHIKVLGATLNGNSLNAINPLAGIVVSGEFLKVVHDIAPGNQTIIHVSGTISITVSGGGAITYDANKMAKISNGAITLLKGGSLGIAGAATIAFQGSVAATDSPTHNPRIGISSFFDARLTAIPVSSNPTNTTTVTPTSSSDSANPEASTTTTSTSSPATTPSFLDTQKTARLSVGVYFPIPLTRWVWKGTNNALFLAPLAKIGFDTLTAATSQNVTLAGGGTGTESYQQLYNFRTFGARIGHMQYSGSPSQAPEVYSYLDIGVGPFSNLESLICHRTLYTPTVGTTPGSPLPGQMTADGYANNGCQGAYSSYYQTPSGPTSEVYEVYETRKRIYRLDFEGLLKIPGTVFYVGFNANLAQKAVGAGRYDPAFKAPDDLRFFFGTKFDISTLLSKLGVNLNN